MQAQLTGSGVSDRDAEKVAAFILDTPILGYLFMLVDAGKTEDYQDFPGEEIRALLILEAELEDVSATLASEVLVAVLQASNQVSSAASARRQSGTRSRPLSGIQLFGAQEAKRRLLSKIGSPSPSAIREYSASFRREMGRKFSRIQLQHLDNGTEQRLEDLYVEPALRLQEPAPTQRPEVRPADVLSMYARAVIQGPAGSGKSTTVRRLASDVANGSNGELAPLVVELRKYSAQQALEPQIFLEHIRQSVTQFMQQAPPEAWLEYLLTTGRAVVFFDGLDEVLSAGTRAEVRDAVITFAQMFPASSIVVTSRYTGYDLAPLDKGEWTHIGVQELREDQVHEYARRWFKLKDSGTDIVERARSFIDESRTYASDLRSNPLMLSLLCSIYYSRGDIPRTLHALYERCADMIYQQWNTMRGLEDHRAWDKDVRPVLYQVAHAVLSNDDYLSFGIPEEELVREVRRAFISNGAPDPEDASRRAREAVRLWAGRAWIITAVMTDEAGRLRYGFVHQSFLEYFAAVFEVRRVDTPADLYENLRGRLIELNGWTVTQIAVSVLEAWKDHGGKRFLAVLLDDARKACDLDTFALLRLGISLVSIVPVPAEQPPS
jgi:predicted NACHT family NTPase